jgi:protein-tyrosine phosphatase
VIDLHAHLLHGLDDGPETLAESVAMAGTAWESGTRTLVCTPHLNRRHPTDPARVHLGVETLAQALRAADVPLEILPGGEIALDHLPAIPDEQLAAASIGGRGDWLLLEMPFRGWPLELPETLRRLELRGLRVLLAHPERCDAVQRSPDRIRELVGLGALVQLTGASFTGDHGAAARRAALTLLAGGTAHVLASDGHSAGPWRPPVLEEGLLAAADGIDVPVGSLRWMVEDVPAAILEGGPVRPPRLSTRRSLRAPARGR